MAFLLKSLQKYIGPYLIQYAPAIAMTMRELFKQYKGREIAKNNLNKLINIHLVYFKF